MSGLLIIEPHAHWTAPRAVRSLLMGPPAWPRCANPLKRRAHEGTMRARALPLRPRGRPRGARCGGRCASTWPRRPGLSQFDAVSTLAAEPAGWGCYPRQQPFLSAAAGDALELLGEAAAALGDCNQRTCAMGKEKEPTGEDLRCDLRKTWPSSAIQRAVNPSFGEALLRPIARQACRHCQRTHSTRVQARGAGPYRGLFDRGRGPVALDQSHAFSNDRVRKGQSGKNMDQSHSYGRDGEHHGISVGRGQA